MLALAALIASTVGANLADAPLASASTANAAKPNVGTRLYVYHVLPVGGTLTSPSGVFTARWQPSGTFILFNAGRRV